MANLIDKDALVAEIEKLKADILQKKGQCKRRGLERIMHQIGAYNKILSFIDTLEVMKIGVDLGDPKGDKSAKYIIDTKNLEVKEVDFEREMQAFAKINLEPLLISDSNIGINITMSQLYDCAKYFFELGLKAQKGE